MSQFPPQPPMPGQPQFGTIPPQRSTSVAAVMSLILGILGCIPVVTSIAAVICGIVGIKKTSNPLVGGRGLAITGLILGLLGIAGWALFGGTVYFGWQEAKKQLAQQAQPFINAVIDGDIQKAATYTSLSVEEIASLRDQMKGWGNVTEMQMSGFDLNKSAAKPNTLVMTGTVTFAQAGTKDFEITLDSSAGGNNMKIIGVHFK